MASKSKKNSKKSEFLGKPGSTGMSKNNKLVKNGQNSRKFLIFLPPFLTFWDILKK